MITEPLPISLFISRQLTDMRAIAIMENWRVEIGIIQKILTGHFRDMGIFMVSPGLERDIVEKMLFMLKHSPDIISRVYKAEQQDLARKQSRHADGG